MRCLTWYALNKAVCKMWRVVVLVFKRNIDHTRINLLIQNKTIENDNEIGKDSCR